MPVRVNRRGRYAQLRVRGDLDAAGSPLLREALLREIGGGARDVTVDMSAVHFADSTAVKVLAEAGDWLAERFGCLSVERPSKAVRDLLALCGEEWRFGFDEAGVSGEAVSEGA